MAKRVPRIVFICHLDMKFIFPSLPEPFLGGNYHVEVMESVGIIELYLDPGRFVFLQLLDLKIFHFRQF